MISYKEMGMSSEEAQKLRDPDSVQSTSDERTVNNVMRHEYRKLSEAEKYSMQRFKDIGAQFYAELELHGASRELSIAKTKIEEAVMWAVKHVTK